MSERVLGWGTTLCAGLVLGFVTLSQWTPYSEYTPVEIDGWVLIAAAIALGTLPPLVFDEAGESLGAGIALVLVACAVPVSATVVTAHLLGTTAVLDVILYSSIQRALGQSISLFVFAIIGVALGMVVGLRIGRG